MSEEILKVENLSKKFKLKRLINNQKIEVDTTSKKATTELTNEFYALKDISFSLKKGEMLGIIGENGSGKSTLLKILSEIMYPTEGQVTYKGQIASILDIGSGFHPELTGRENALMYASFLGLDKKHVKNGMNQIIEFSEIGDFIDQSVKFYSNGMYLRLAFAVAFYCKVDIMVLDEVLSVGDSAFTIKSHQRIQTLLEQGTSIILVSHNISEIVKTCDRCIWLDKGKIIKTGPASEIMAAYLQANWWTKRKHLINSEKAEKTAIISNFKTGSDLLDEKIKLQKMTVSPSADNSPAGVIDYNDDIKVELQYERLIDGGIIHCGIVVVDQFNTAIAFSTPLNPNHVIDLQSKHTKGIYKHTCIIPKRLFNIGSYSLYLRIGYDIIDMIEIKNVVLFKIVSDGKHQRSILEKNPLSICANFNWTLEKL